MTQRVSTLVREHCYGCQYNMPRQRGHSCLEEDVEQNYLHLVELSNVAENVGKVILILGLEEAEYAPHEETTDKLSIIQISSIFVKYWVRSKYLLLKS